jgi:hypothetical protein
MMLSSDLDLKTTGQVLGQSSVALTARYFARKTAGRESPRSDLNRRPDAYKAPALAN